MSLIACKEDAKEPLNEESLEEVAIVEPDVYEFGFNLNNYIVKRDTVRKGDTFGIILERNKVGYPKIFHIAEKAKDTFDIRRSLQVGKPYTLLCSKDSLEIARCFIYQPNIEDYVVVNFQDSIHAIPVESPLSMLKKQQQVL